jgi:hypothetical protein
MYLNQDVVEIISSFIVPPCIIQEPISYLDFIKFTRLSTLCTDIKSQSKIKWRKTILDYYFTSTLENNKVIASLFFTLIFHNMDVIVHKTYLLLEYKNSIKNKGLLYVGKFVFLLVPYE